MKNINNGAYLSRGSAEESIIPLVALCISIATILLIPLKILGYGFLPTDDIMRHVAKAISGRSWNDILILRDGIQLDSHPGFHALLTAVYNITKLSPDDLVYFAVTTLFAAFCLFPLFFVKRFEAWLTALLLISLTNFSFIMRLLFGRPYMVAMTTLVVLCLVWTRLRDDKRPYKTMILVTLLVALSTWIHCSWYLIAFPIVCFIIAREWRVAIILSVCSIVGIFVGAALTGHPWLFISQNIIHAFLVFNKHAFTRTLTIELRPFTGDILTVMAVVFMLSWRRMRGSWEAKRIDNPVFILVVFSWIMGFFVGRFWFDFGIPALLVWMAQEFDDVYTRFVSPVSARRIFLTAAVALTLYANTTNDINDRWSASPAAEYLFRDFPEKASWMPDPGGIVYSDDLRVFFVTFFKNPYAPWRYIVGFEPALMPQKDLDVFMDIQISRGAAQSFGPWIKKMRPEDRLVITTESNQAPLIGELEWRYMGSGFWFGRLRRAK